MLLCCHHAATSFLQYKTYKLAYRRYAGLYFIFCIDVTDNELLYLETIHLFVEVCIMLGFAIRFQRDRTSYRSLILNRHGNLSLQILDHYFGNVCELDLVFGFHKVYCILDEFIIGGEVQETSKKVILERLKELHSLET